MCYGTYENHTNDYTSYPNTRYYSCPVLVFFLSYRDSDVDNEESEHSKRRRSSFAASFYSAPARPKSERSLRRSNGRINYSEDEEAKDSDKESQAEHEPGSNSPIRRKKKPLNERNETAENSKDVGILTDSSTK